MCFGFCPYRFSFEYLVYTKCLWLNEYMGLFLGNTAQDFSGVSHGFRSLLRV